MAIITAHVTTPSAGPTQRPPRHVVVGDGVDGERAGGQPECTGDAHGRQRHLDDEQRRGERDEDQHDARLIEQPVHDVKRTSGEVFEAPEQGP